MIARLLISSSLEQRIIEIEKILGDHGLKINHPDVLYFPNNSKLGIEQARKIKEHLSFKPFQAKGRGVALEDASSLTVEAQNALLKILEEPPAESIIILGASSDVTFLPTVLSRCQVVILNSFQDPSDEKMLKPVQHDIEELLKADIAERFEYIEKIKDKETFLKSLVVYFHQNLPANTDFLKELLQAEQWENQNVNIRAILEYLMLKMPKI